MTVWQDISQSVLVERIGEALLLGSLQIVAIALLTALAWRLLQRAELRYAAGCLGLALALAAPIASFVWLTGTESRSATRFSGDEFATLSNEATTSTAAPRREPLAESTSQPVAKVEASQASVDASPVDASAPGAAPSHSSTALDTRIQRLVRPWLPHFVLLWAIGVLLFAARPVIGAWTLHSLRRHGHRPIASTLQACFEQLVERIGLRRPVALVESSRVRAPLVLGWLRPMILLPASALTGLSPRELEAVLLHELAHIRRHDALINLLPTLVETLLFFHPAVWWLSARLRQEREHCCDDFAARILGDRPVLARALLRLEEHRQAKALALSTGGPKLLPRVQRLLGRPPRRSTLPGWIAGALLALIPITVLALGLWQDGQETPSRTPVTAEQAVALAERFVRENGYTKAPPVEDLDRIRLESVERFQDIGRILRSRHDTLDPWAVGISRTELGWTIGFRYTRSAENVGRAVTMNQRGEEIRMQHQDFLLASLETKLPARFQQEVDPETWVAIGRVIDRDGRPIEDATVRVATGFGTLLGGGSTKTDELGFYRLEFGEGMFTTDPDSPNRQVAWFFVEAPGYVQWSRSRPEHLSMVRFRPVIEDLDSADFDSNLVVRGEPYRLDFELTKPATLLVGVVDELGQPIDDPGLQLDDSNQTSLARGADEAREDARYAWDIRPDHTWTFSIPAEGRFRTRSDPLTPPAPGDYRVLLRLIRGAESAPDTLQVVRVLDGAGREVTHEVVEVDPSAQPPLDEASQREARQILERVMEVNRYWLSDLPAGVTSFTYRLGETEVRATPATDAARKPVHRSILHQLSTLLDDMTFRYHDQGSDVITIAYTLASPARVEIGNGLPAAGGSYRGYFSQPVRSGVLRIDALRLTPVEHRMEDLVETFSDWRQLDEQHLVPLKIEIEGSTRFEWPFELYEPGLWILERLSGDEAPRVTDVTVNGRGGVLKDR